VKEEKLTLEEHFKKCTSELFANKELFRYSDSNNFYKLIYDGQHFCIHIQLIDLSLEFDWSSEMHYHKSFKTIDEFWEYLTADDNWLIIYKPEKFGFGTDKIVAKHIVHFHNHFMKSDFLTSDYWLLHKWMNGVYSDSIERSEYKQYCSNCKTLTFKNSRYPKYLCGDCMELIVDDQGEIVQFSKPEEYDSTVYFLNNIAYFAEEAYMGGIVIQLKE